MTRVHTASLVALSLLLSDCYAFQSNQPLKPTFVQQQQQSLKAFVPSSTDFGFFNQAVTAPTLRPQRPAVVDSKAATTTVNKSLIETICTAQIASLTIAAVIATALGQGSNVLDWITASSVNDLPTTLLQGALAALPMIAVQTIVAESSQHAASRVHLQTTNLVQELFGRRDDSSRSSVAPWSMLLTTVTSICEELVYRGIVPAVIYHSTLGSGGNNMMAMALAVLGQAAVYSATHFNPVDNVSSNSNNEENKLVAAMNGFTSLWYSLIFVATGGNIIPCILGHLFLDMHVFTETWQQTNNQLDWANKQAKQPLSLQEKQGVTQLQQNVSRQTLLHARKLFLSFDRDQKGLLSLADVQRAAAYAFWQDSDKDVVAALFNDIIRQEAKDSRSEKRVRFDEFLQIMLTLQQQAHASTDNAQLQL